MSEGKQNRRGQGEKEIQRKRIKTQRTRKNPMVKKMKTKRKE